MRIFFLTIIALFFLASCGTNSSQSDSDISGQFISDAKNILPPKPPGYEENSSQGER